MAMHVLYRASNVSNLFRIFLLLTSPFILSRIKAHSNLTGANFLLEGTTEINEIMQHK